MGSADPASEREEHDHVMRARWVLVMTALALALGATLAGAPRIPPAAAQQVAPQPPPAPQVESPGPPLSLEGWRGGG